jgi:hypothetical protein
MADLSRPDPRPWQGTRRAPPGGLAPARPPRRKVLALAGTVLALAGAIAGVIYWLRPVPPPYFLAAWIDQYPDPRVPVNPWAAQDRQALLDVGWHDENAFTNQSQDRLVGKLHALQGRADTPVVVYLSAFALTGEDGRVSLLPNDARLDGPSTWLPLRNVLDFLRACPSRHKLLILDVMHPFTEPRVGVLANEVAARARAELDDGLAQDPRLFVLCACSPGQVSLASEDLGHSVFGYYLKRGLAGAADGQRDGKRDGQVSVRELADYVTTRVDRWAERNRGARQTPLFLAGESAGDFHLVSVAGDRTPPSEPQEGESYPDWLRKAWALRDGWWASPRSRAPVAVYRELDAALLRAERHWRGGTDPGRAQTFFKDPAGEFRRHTELARSADAAEPRSLAEEAARGTPTPDLKAGETLSELRKLAQLDARARGPKGEGKEQLAGERERFLKNKAFEGKPFALAWAVFEAACDEPAPRPEQVLFWDDLLLAYRRDVLKDGPPQFPYAETRYLGRLAGLAAKAVKAGGPAPDWPAGAVHQALRAFRARERVEAGDPPALSWVRSRAQGAERRRCAGEEALFGPAPGTGQAERLLGEARRDYELVLRELETVQEALRRRDEALALLPGYLPYLEHDPGKETAWAEAAAGAGDLRGLLAKPPEGGRPPADFFHRLESVSDGLGARLGDLRKPFERGKQGEGARPGRRDDRAAWREIDALLDCSWSSAGEREALWKAGRELGRRLRQETEAAEDREDRAGGRPAPLPAFDSDKAGRVERWLALRRAEWSVVLLKLDGRADVRELKKALASADPEKPDTWQAVRRQLRGAWAGRGPAPPPEE